MPQADIEGAKLDADLQSEDDIPGVESHQNRKS
jgi:hypothetical protein